MRVLTILTMVMGLMMFTSCAHMGKDCCSKKAHHAKIKACKDGKCKLDKSCCKNSCKKCDGKKSCAESKNCDLKKKDCCEKKA
jgi:hypothetical protein